MNFFSSSSAALGFFSMGLSFFIFLFRRASLHRLWALFNLSVAIWGFGLFFATSTQEFSKAIFYWRIAHIGGLFISILFYHTTITLCQRKRKWLILFAYIQASFFVILSWTNLLINKVDFVCGNFYYNIATPLYSFGLFFWFLFAVLGFCELSIRERSESGINRSKIRYLLFAFLVGFVGGATYFIPMYRISFFPIGNFTIPIYCSIATYAILKYRLLDIKIIFTRATVFILVYSIILGIPFAMVFNFKNILISFLGREIWWYAPLGTVVLFATFGPFIYLYFDRKAEERLLKEQRQYQNILRGASSGMIRIKDLFRLLNIIVHVVTKTVKLKFAAIYLLESDDNRYLLKAFRENKSLFKKAQFIDSGSPLVWMLASKKEPIVTEEVLLKSKEDPANHILTKLMDQLTLMEAALVVPSLVENRLIGILVLGEKRSKKLYSQDDIVVFSVLANQAALAIENAQFYDEIKKTHEQLFQAEKLATIGTMADGLSHQINNRFHALSLIAGDSLDMLKTFDFSTCNDQTKQVLADLRGALERIESNVLQGGEVVKGLLKYSRPGDTGHEAVDFKDVVNGSIDMVQYKIKLKEIDLIQDIPQDIPKIHANLIQLQEVFFNLIDNAYDAIKERQTTLKEEGYRGKIQIQVHLSSGVLGVVVSDNGMGIKDLYRKKLFTPFFTTKATAKKGTGLGLYVIEKIISSHNGKIVIDSTYLSGTQFSISLPIFKSAVK